MTPSSSQVFSWIVESLQAQEKTNTLGEILTSPYLIENDASLEIWALKIDGQFEMHSPAFICHFAASRETKGNYEYFTDVDALCDWRNQQTQGNQKQWQEWARKTIEEVNTPPVFA